jgi:hypothetical protein
VSSCWPEAAPTYHACVVDDHIDPTELLHGLVYDRSPIGNAVVVRNGPSFAGLLDLLNDLVGINPRQIVDDNARAAAGKQQRIAAIA